MSGPSFSPVQLALIGFLSHAPGLRLFARVSISPFALRLNLAFAVVTVGAVTAAAWRFSDQVLQAVVIAWLVGHLAWSSTLAALVLRGHVVRKPAE